MPDSPTPGDERLRAVWEAASDAMAVSDPQGVVLAANRAYEQLYGYSAEELVGHNFAIIFPENLREWANEGYRETFTNPTIAPAVEITIQRKDGTERMVEARYTFVMQGEERTAMVSIIRDITEQKRAEAEIQQRKQEFETLAEHAPDIITRHEALPPFRYLYVNPAITEATGIPTQDFPGKTCREVGLNEPLCAFFEKQLGYVTSIGQPTTTEYTDETPRGLRHYRSRLVPEYDVSGDISTVLVVSHDITDIRRAEAELRASQETFQSAFEHAPIGIALLGLDGSYLQANPAFCAFTGYSEEELRGMTFKSLSHPEDLPVDTEALNRLRAGELGSYRMEKRYIRKGGEIVWALLSVSLVRDAEGNPLHYIRQTEDITERRKAEQALREVEARFRSLVDGNIIGILRVDMERIINANDAFLQMVGYTHQDLIEGNLRWRGMTPPEWAPADEQGLEEMVARGAATPFEKELFSKDGRRVPILIGATLLTRTPLTWMCFVLDLTERKQAEANERQARLEAERAVLDRDRLLSIVAHDLRSPLTSIKGNAQVLLHRLGAAKRADGEQLGKLERQVQQIERSAVQMNRMIEEILDFSNLQAGAPLLLRDQPTDLVELVRRVVEECQRNAPRQEVRLAAAIPQVIGQWDPSRLQRVFSNLLDNAVKYSPPGRVVRVEIEMEREQEQRDENGPGGGATKADRVKNAECVRVTIVDQGIGIPAEDLPYIFEWYRRASNASSWAGGTGIGLAGAQQIVKQYGGTISVESVEGKGSTVTVLLPASS